MSSKKHDLEIVYSLRWKNRTKREESKEMSAVVVVYDIPSTTLNFETFKNYLLKNSGTPGNDVRVYFFMDNGKEYLIQSQTDFQVALYAFRRKARAGEMINLLLERVSEEPTHKNLRHSNDVETQFDNVDATSIVSTCCNADTAPEWFIAGLAQLKKEIKDEITSTMSTLIASAVADIKSPCVAPVPAQHASCSNRARAKPYKWSRKLTPQLVENITDTKVLLKSLKLENKLDKLERKASKYREKRHALQHGQKSSDNAPKSSDSEAGPSESNSRPMGKEIKRKLEEHQCKQEEPIDRQQSDEPKMGARPVSRHRSVPHMLGGETYLHQWEVQNTGEAQWTLMTQLQYTWGSKKLIPISQYISVPHLKPGEIGTISVRLHIPTHPGIYECYWQFLHKGRRFGDWLDVQVIVDPFDLKGHSSVLEHSGPQACNFINPSELQENLEKITNEPQQILLQEDPHLEVSAYKSLHDQDKIDRFKVLHQMDRMSLEDEAKSELLNRLIKEEEVDSDCSWNSERARFNEFVLMPPVPQCYALDSRDPTNPQAKNPAKQADVELSGVTPDLKTNKAGSSESFDDNNNTDCVSRSSVNSIKFRDEELDNIVVITVPKDEQVKEGFMYVHVDGQKVLIPKNILKSQIISAAQEFDSHLSGSNSSGIAIDASETLNKSPTPSLASTIINQDAEVNGANKPKQENLISAESLELFCDLQEYPSCAQQAVDLTVGPRDVSDTNTVDEALDRSSYFEANNFMSHCSAAGSCFSEFNTNAERQTRMFVFPQDVPGYEVIYSTTELNPEEATLTTGSCVAPTPNQPASVLSQEAPSHPLEAVPNYQQTPVELRRSPVQPPQATVRETEPVASTQPLQEPTPEQTAQHRPNAQSGWVSPPRQLVAEGLVSGALSAARSVMNMIRPQSPGRWVNGHWVSSSPETPREANLQALAEMGFWNRDLNATLLARYSDDLNRVVAELVQ